MGPSCHLPCSTTVAVLLWCITVCLTLHAVRAQSATFTSTVAGKEFTTFSFPTFDRSLMQLPANLTFAGNSSVTQNTLQITPDSNSASGPDNFLVNQTGSVFLSSPFVLPGVPVLDAPLDLSAVLLGKRAYFGFSASTGVKYQFNCVRMWNMTVERLLDSSTAGRSISGRKIGAAVGVPCAIVLAIGLLAGLYIRRKSKMVAGVTAVDLSAIPGMPREFDFRELKRGTNNFDEKMKLGQGGYGVVYRATVAGEGGRSMEVAVKQFSGANTKGQENFLAELSIINRLRHRNLVKLIVEVNKETTIFHRYTIAKAKEITSTK
uniref:Putative LRR receptor-like serine/threonine-protein kinase n=1 Tax=Aegilops tauschii TaxID=37682 RepID=N1QWT8_AEGTA